MFDRSQDAWRHYQRHLEQMEGLLPADLLTLARLPGVDDGLVVLARHDRARRVLSLTLRVGDMQIGYSDLVLRYEGADISPEHARMLALIARTTRSEAWHSTDIVYHELDRTEGGMIEHRLLFHPGLWFSVRCEALRWVRLPCRDRRLPCRSDRFPGGPVTPGIEKGTRSWAGIVGEAVEAQAERSALSSGPQPETTSQIRASRVHG